MLLLIQKMLGKSRNVVVKRAVSPFRHLQCLQGRKILSFPDSATAQSPQRDLFLGGVRLWLNKSQRPPSASRRVGAGFPAALPGSRDSPAVKLWSCSSALYTQTLPKGMTHGSWFWNIKHRTSLEEENNQQKWKKTALKTIKTPRYTKHGS